MFKNMRVFIAYCMFFNPGRKMATGFTNTPSCFRILDSANSSIDLKLKEAFYISKNKPDLNKQLHHFNTFLTL